MRGCGDDACLKILQSSGRTIGGRELADDALVLDQCQCSILSSLDPGGHTHIQGLQPAEGSHRPGACASLASKNRGGGERGYELREVSVFITFMYMHPWCGVMVVEGVWSQRL